MAAMWATDGRKHTYPGPLQGVFAFILVSGLWLNVEVGYYSFIKCLPSTPLPQMTLKLLPQGDVGHIPYLIPAVLS